MQSGNESLFANQVNSDDSNVVDPDPNLGTI